jgi:uncharacterized membrane-anchored protein
MLPALHQRPTTRQLLNKVPEVTLYFWVIKVLCTTVGETASDYLVDNVGLGLTMTTFITGALLIAALAFQFRSSRYVASLYWLAVVLISVVGTQITDNLTDNLGVSLVTTTAVFSVLLAAVFATWYRFERTLSIHTIYTRRREGFYWLAVLFTFALGTAAGDLTAERLNLGYLVSLLLFAGLIAAVAGAHFAFDLNAIAAFWMAYILTRPLGASLGDYLSQPTADGGRGLGTTATSALFLTAILLVVVYLSITKKDATATATAPVHAGPVTHVLVVAHDTGATRVLLDAIRERALLSPARFHLLVPNPAGHAELTAAERARSHAEGDRALADALPLVALAAGGDVEGSASIRHDPMDAIEETLDGGDFREIILSSPPRSVARSLHLDLPHRVAHVGLPLTTVVDEKHDEVRGFGAESAPASPPA